MPLIMAGPSQCICYKGASMGAGSPDPKTFKRLTVKATALQISLLSFRMQFIVAGPGLVPWMYDPPFLAGMTDYLGPNSGVGNLTIRNWG